MRRKKRMFLNFLFQVPSRKITQKKKKREEILAKEQGRMYFLNLKKVKGENNQKNKVEGV